MGLAVLTKGLTECAVLACSLLSYEGHQQDQHQILASSQTPKPPELLFFTHYPLAQAKTIYVFKIYTYARACKQMCTDYITLSTK